MIAKRNIQSITTVVLHHSAVTPPVNTVTQLWERIGQFDTRHKNEAIANKWNTETPGEFGPHWISYHFVVNGRSDSAQVQDVSYPRFHASNYPVNLVSVAICVDANTDYDWVTDDQLIEIARIIRNLETKLQKTLTITYHGDVAQPGHATDCPGKWLKTRMNDVNQCVQRMRDGETLYKSYEPRPVVPAVPSQPPTNEPEKPVIVVPPANFNPNPMQPSSDTQKPLITPPSVQDIVASMTPEQKQALLESLKQNTPSLVTKLVTWFGTLPKPVQIYAYHVASLLIMLAGAALVSYLEKLQLPEPFIAIGLTTSFFIMNVNVGIHWAITKLQKAAGQ